MLNSLASNEINCEAVLSPKSAPAFSIANPYSSASTPAISANSLAAATSWSVQVGDLNNKESEMIADSIRPAMLGSISTPFSLYILFKIVAVHPTGSAR